VGDEGKPPPMEVFFILLGFLEHSLIDYALSSIVFVVNAEKPNHFRSEIKVFILYQIDYNKMMGIKRLI
jgi:hypothetical protein